MFHHNSDNQFDQLSSKTNGISSAYLRSSWVSSHLWWTWFYYYAGSQPAVLQSEPQSSSPCGGQRRGCPPVECRQESRTWIGAHERPSGCSHFTSRSEAHLADGEAEHLLKIRRLADKEQVEGPTAAEVGHDDGVHRHGGKETAPRSLEFLGVRHGSSCWRILL